MTAIAIRSGKICLTRKAGSVVPVDVAPDEPPNKMRWLREKPVQLVSIISKTQCTGNHGHTHNLNSGSGYVTCYLIPDHVLYEGWYS